MSMSNLNSNEKYQIKNQRPDDYLEEREVYEKLCRQNQTEVRSIRMSDSSLSLIIFS